MVDGNTVLASIIIVATFIVTLFLTKGWIRVARAFGLVGKDMNKFEKKEVPESGGIAVLFGITFGLLFFIFFKTFLIQTETHLIEIFVIMLTILLAGFLGFIDDILGWKKGLKQWQKPLLTIPIALPLTVLNVNHSTISIPFLGNIDFGLLYPFLIVPIGIVGAANGYNMLAGYNGLEAGLGVIILSTLGFVALKSRASWLALVVFIAVAALLAFLLFNWYPARVFPGDSLTYAIGALIAAVVILGNTERAGLLLFAPYFAELALKAKSKFKAESFGIPQRDGSLAAPERTSSLTHLFIKVFKHEKSAVRGLLALEVILAAIVLIYL
jgi:UDP-N-acetylglucosamine--dolichyl-phosphate N-acetylglucosaminephosphotransferase